MDSNSVWELLSGIEIGTIVAWFAVIAAIVTGICTGTIKLYKVFMKYTKLKDENEEQKKLLQKHEDVLNEVNDSLKKITASLDEQKEVNLKQIRYSIVHACDDAVSCGYITAGKLKTVEELYDEYTNIFHGNGYVKTLINKVRRLEVRGTLDD